MREGWRVAAVTALLSLVAVDIGMHAQHVAGQIGLTSADMSLAASPAPGRKGADAPTAPATLVMPASDGLFGGAKFTDYALSVFAAGSALFALLQTAAARRQVLIMGKQFDVMERQFKLAALQTDILEKQKEIQRFEYAQMHRPRLVIRQIQIIFPVEGQPLKISYLLKNVGGTETAVCEIVVNVYYPTVSQTSTQMLRVKDRFSMPVGENIRRTHEFSEIPFTAVPAANSAPPIFTGYITYTSQMIDREFANTTYQLGFIRSYDVVNRRFYVVEDPECEYSD